jgi:hypothetical protein
MAVDVDCDVAVDVDYDMLQALTWHFSIRPNFGPIDVLGLLLFWPK